MIRLRNIKVLVEITGTLREDEPMEEILEDLEELTANHSRNDLSFQLLSSLCDPEFCQGYITYKETVELYNKLRKPALVELITHAKGPIKHHFPIVLDDLKVIVDLYKGGDPDEEYLIGYWEVKLYDMFM